MRVSLNPLYVGSRLLLPAELVARLAAVLIPFMSGLVYYHNTRRAPSRGLVLIPFMSGLVYYADWADRARAARLNPLYVGSRLLQHLVEALAADEVLIPFMSGLVYYCRRPAGGPARRLNPLYVGSRLLRVRTSRPSWSLGS